MWQVYYLLHVSTTLGYCPLGYCRPANLLWRAWRGRVRSDSCESWPRCPVNDPDEHPQKTTCKVNIHHQIQAFQLAWKFHIQGRKIRIEADLPLSLLWTLGPKLTGTGSKADKCKICLKQQQKELKAHVHVTSINRVAAFKDFLGAISCIHLLKFHRSTVSFMLNALLWTCNFQ